MRPLSIKFVIGLAFVINANVFAGEIREFSVPTLERLGRELTQASQRPDRGATDPIRKQAIQTAKAAVQGQLFNIRYDYVVLNDPDGSGFLVYALGVTKNSDEVVLAGHCRVTVSSDGQKVKRVDALSQSLLVMGGRHSEVPKGYHGTGLYFNQIVSTKPVETFIYSSNRVNKNIYVGTPDGKLWVVSKGKLRVDTSRPGSDTEAAAAHKALGR